MREPRVQQMKRLVRIGSFIAQTPFIRTAIEDHADLSAFRGYPPLSVIAGVSLICLSFLVSWPAITVLGIFSLHHSTPLLFAIGAPLLYATSHLVFIAGMALSAAKYSLIFLRWLARIVFERFPPIPDNRPQEGNDTTITSDSPTPPGS